MGHFIRILAHRQIILYREIINKQRPIVAKTACQKLLIILLAETVTHCVRLSECTGKLGMLRAGETL